MVDIATLPTTPEDDDVAAVERQLAEVHRLADERIREQLGAGLEVGLARLRSARRVRAEVLGVLAACDVGWED